MEIKKSEFVTLTIQVPRKIYESLQEAGGIVGKVGISIPVKKMAEMIATAEFERLNPQKMAKRFSQAIISTLKSNNQIDDDDLLDDDEEPSNVKAEAKLETVSN